ncbi:NADAR family protein [Burkholderia metallica]|uniref:NADAR family protein n=1 Tax=Burkholderia metallica TaxID=488729 RepID=UPI001CF166D5|nr:NADAR family protein [Burkholderia metallica]MCA8002771.1 NADAR family protein [Burkholderia metallica]
MRRIGNFTAFFGAEDVLSNWHPSRFSYHEVDFNCVEQFMMYAKAMLFDDHEVAAKILETPSPKKQKQLGRDVSGFDEEIWLRSRESIVFVGCREKFRQNPDQGRVLSGTGSTILVEASRSDCIWGAGIEQWDPRITDPAKWPGLNLLGNTLMRVREVHFSM